MKTKAARRVLHLPDPLIAMLKRHRREQAKQRLLAAKMWVDSGYAFRGVLSTAGVSSTRIHDLRHTNAPLLLLEAVPSRVVQDLTG